MDFLSELDQEIFNRRLADVRVLSGYLINGLAKNHKSYIFKFCASCQVQRYQTYKVLPYVYSTLHFSA